MKKFISTIRFAILLFILNSCTKENSDDGKTYYKFVENDYQFIINYNYTANQVLIYENQNGEKLHFKVISNIAEKTGQYSGGGGLVGSSSSLDYYYDNKIIRIGIVENQNNFREGQVIYNFSKSENIFKNAINFPMINISSSSFFDEIDRPFNVGLNAFNPANKTQKVVNGKTFSRVIEFNSNNPAVLNITSGALTKNVNKIFYDYDFGIIQFEEINGKIWKVKYP